MNAPQLTAAGRRRDAILAVAHDVFLEHGFEGASMALVAARLGGSKGTLYSYFDSKEALFDALVADSCTRNGVARFDPPLGTGPEAWLLGFARAYIALVCSPWATRMLQIIAVEARRRPALGALFYDAGPAVALARLGDQFATFAAAGQLTIADPAAAAETFASLCRGNLHLQRLLGIAPEPNDAAIDAHARSAVDQFLRLYACDHFRDDVLDPQKMSDR